MSKSTTRRRRATRVALAGAALTLGAVAITPSAQATGSRPSNTPAVVILTETGRLVTANSENPRRTQLDVAVSGLAPGEELVGIDRRPKDGLVYGVARSPQATRLYSVDTTTGVVTAVADLVTTSGAPVVLLGSAFGVDVNPAADAIRIVSDGGQNLRVLPEDRVVEGTPRPKGTTFVDGTLNEGGFAESGVGAAAYTGNDNDPATATKLYVLDSDSGRLLVQDPPNAGALTTPVDLRPWWSTELTAFDIVTSGTTETAYAALAKDRWDRSQLVRIDLATGKVSAFGTFSVDGGVRGIAV
jgi:hypothetical protein